LEPLIVVIVVAAAAAAASDIVLLLFTTHAPTLSKIQSEIHHSPTRPCIAAFGSHTHITVISHVIAS
jgi:hypothetical protein